MKLLPVSSGSGNPASPAEITETPSGSSNSAISVTLPELWLAITIFESVNLLICWCI